MFYEIKILLFLVLVGQFTFGQTRGTDHAVMFKQPVYHFTPDSAWMNDPNGLVYNEGLYHLFYQYNPDSLVWGPMHWGHATSSDLINWKRQPIALYPDSLGWIFSGSVVVDRENTSGFQMGGNLVMVAIFTYHLNEKGLQTQGLAYSNDNGLTWKKYDGNPVIKNPGIRDFRDPKVFWDEDSKHWIMSLAAHHGIHFYKSQD